MKVARDLDDERVAYLKTLPWMSAPSGGWLLPVSIVRRITVDPITGCWRVGGWNTGKEGQTRGWGFANIMIKGRTYKVHRVVWRLTKGSIPDKHILDHKKHDEHPCRYRDCCHPDHLEPVDNRTNTFRGDFIPYKTKEEYQNG